jgi:hypothetical protein
MGYQTNYELIVDNDIAADVEAAILEVSGYQFDCGSLYNAKWYDHDEDMREVSKQFPDRVITLYGNGEDADDQWYAYFKNGKMQWCPAIITYDPFDESKLS